MIQPIRTLVVDDDRAARERLLAMMQADPEIAVVGECGVGEEAVACIERLRPDLVLLDPGGDSAERSAEQLALLSALRGEDRPEVVFVSAHAEFALHAVEVHALAYLLKPVGEERLTDALRQAKARVCQRRIAELGRQLATLLTGTAPAEGVEMLDGVVGRGGRDAGERGAPRVMHAPRDRRARSPYVDRIAVRHGRDTLFVTTEELDWIEAADYYVKLHTGGKSYLVRETMQRMEKRLDPRRFARIHRSTIVNVDRVKRIQAAGRSGHLVLLRDGTQLPMSRSRKEALEQALGQTL